MKTKLTEMFGIEYPIVQSGMQWLAVPQLAAAVCNAGGIGTINVTCWPTLDEFADALDEMNSLTNKPYIVNISLAPTQRLDNEEIRKTIRLCGEKHVAAIETSAEDPREFIADIKSAGMRHFHKCPNYKVSMSMERKGLDGVIIAGYEVGGHPSADGVGTFVIARRCSADMKIPVIAAGGVYTGEDIKKYMDLGASGVQMGTRFVATYECDADDRFKQAYIDAKQEDVTIIKSPVGMPGRALVNNFIDSMRDGGKKPFKCIFHCVKTCEQEKTPYCIAAALINAMKGNLERGFAFCGENVSRVNNIVSVHDLISSLQREFDAIINKPAAATVKA